MFSNKPRELFNLLESNETSYEDLSSGNDDEIANAINFESNSYSSDFEKGLADIYFSSERKPSPVKTKVIKTTTRKPPKKPKGLALQPINESNLPVTVSKKLKEKIKVRIVNASCYDEMFENVWNEAKLSIKTSMIGFPITAQNSTVIEWITKMDSTEIIFIIFKEMLRILFTETASNNLYCEYKKIIKYINYTEVLSYYQNIEIKDGDKVTGLNIILRQIYNAGLLYSTQSGVDPPHDEVKGISEDDDIFYYVIGYLLNNLLNHKSSEEKKKLGRVLEETEVKKVPFKYRRWTEVQDRGGLKYPNQEALQMFEEIQKHVGKFYGKIYYANKRKKAVEAIESDANIALKWAEICTRATINETLASQIKQMFVRKYLNTIGKGHTNKLRNENKGQERAKQMDNKVKSKEKTEKKVVKKFLEEEKIRDTHCLI